MLLMKLTMGAILSLFSINSFGQDSDEDDDTFVYKKAP
jgi:hypothetical protein